MLLLLQHLKKYMCNITPQKQTLKWNVIHKSTSCVMAGKREFHSFNKCVAFYSDALYHS